MIPGDIFEGQSKKKVNRFKLILSTLMDACQSKYLYPDLSTGKMK
jgi:hypothetical protein